MRAQLARIDAVLVQAVIAAALSFAHLHDIADAAGQHGWKAWAYPVSVDLLLVAAWRRLRSGGSGKGASWCWFVIALTASLGANVSTAGLLDVGAVPAWLRILVAGWPAVAFLGGTLLAHGAPKPHRSELTPASEPESTPAEPGAPPVEHPVPAATPEPAAVQVPAALVEHARKVAAAHHTRTGSPIDTPTLRARLGVPLRDGSRVRKLPKSSAGVRSVAVPETILPEVRRHLRAYSEAGPDGRVFIGAKKATPRRNHFNRLWQKACADAGVKGLHFHDLRHTGNTMAASTGASTRELMTRLGHSTARAALRYQHATAERERVIADAVNAQILDGLKRGSGRNGHATGTPGE